MVVVQSVLVLHGFFSLPANAQWDLFCHAENLPKSQKAGKRKGQAAETWPDEAKLATRSLAVIPIVIAVPVMAPLARFFQVMAACLRLAAVFTVLALGLAQSALRVADSLLAPSVAVVVAVQRPRGNCPAQE
jgi:hypothetical protein